MCSLPLRNWSIVYYYFYNISLEFVMNQLFLESIWNVRNTLNNMWGKYQDVWCRPFNLKDDGCSRNAGDRRNRIGVKLSPYELFPLFHLLFLLEFHRTCLRLCVNETAFLLAYVVFVIY